MEAASTSAPRAGRPLDERATGAILQAALGQLLQHGYGGMSMEGVASAAGVGKPAIYRRHHNKADLVAAAIRSLLPVLDVPDTGSSLKDLRALANQVQGLTGTPFAALIGTVLSEMDRQPELIEAFRERIAHPRRDIVKRVLRQGIERGEVRADLDLEQASEVFIGMVLGRHIAGLEFDEPWLDSAFGFFWRGVRADPPGSPAPPKVRD